jgi:hypothetical protein
VLLRRTAIVNGRLGPQTWDGGRRRNAMDKALRVPPA